MTSTLFPKTTLDNARRCIDAGRLTPDAHRDGSYHVAGSNGDSYRVTIDYDGPAAVWATCTCPYGRRRRYLGQTLCYHATAALATVLRERGENLATLLDIREA